MGGARRLGRAVAGVVMASGLALAASGGSMKADEAAVGIEDHFKYGSVGAEERSGLPYWIWRVLPIVFEDKLPAAAGPRLRAPRVPRRRREPRAAHRHVVQVGRWSTSSG